MRKIVLVALFSFALAAGLTIAYLEAGSWVGGLLAGAAASLIVRSAAPKLIGIIRQNPKHEPDLPYQLAIVGLTAILTFLLINAFQGYTIQTQENPSVSLIEEQGRYRMADIAFDGDRYVAGGWYRLADTDDYIDASIWTSDDGYSWTKIPKDLNGELFGGIAIDGNRVAHRYIEGVKAMSDGSVLLLGSDTAPDSVARGVAWRLPKGKEEAEIAVDLSFPTASIYRSYEKHGSDEVLTGVDQGNTVVWVRRAGADWEATSFGEAADFVFDAAVYLDGKWILAGWDKSTDPLYPDRPDYTYARDAVIWTADSDFEWKKTTGFEGVRGSQVISDVVLVHDIWLAVGEDDRGNTMEMDAAIWRSDDGETWKQINDRELTGTGGWQAMAGAVYDDQSERLVIVGGQVIGEDRPGRVIPEDRKFSIWANAAWETTFLPARGVRWSKLYDWWPW